MPVTTLILSGLRDLCIGVSANWIFTTARRYQDDRADRRRAEELADVTAERVLTWFEGAMEHENVSHDQSLLLLQQVEILRDGLRTNINPDIIVASSGDIGELKRLCNEWAPISRDLAGDIGMNQIYDRLLICLLKEVVRAMASYKELQGLAGLRGLQDHDEIRAKLDVLTEKMTYQRQETRPTAPKYVPHRFDLPSTFVPPFVVPEISERSDVRAEPMPVATLLQGRDRAVQLVGHAGIGKTETLKFLFNQAMDGMSDKSVPVFFSFRSLEHVESAVLDAISHDGIAASDLGNAALFLDGLNESSANTRPRMIAAVYRTIDRCASARLLVSCRTRVFSDDGRIELLTPYRLLPFNMEQVRAFALRRLGDAAEAFLQVVLQAKCLCELAEIPYYLEALAAKFERGIPIGNENRALLVLDLIENRLRSDCSKGVFGEDRSQAAEDRINRLLNRLALGMQLLGRRTLLPADIRAMPVHEEDKEILRLVEVVDFPSPDGPLCFTHDLIQETLAARALAGVPVDGLKECNLFFAGAEGRESAIGNVFSLLGQLRRDDEYKGWIFERGPEFYLGAFRGELTPEEGDHALRTILEHFSGKGIPVNWQKYEAADLAGLTVPDRSAPLLLDEIRSGKSRYAVTNAIRILGYCDIPEGLRAQTRETLLSLALNVEDLLTARFAVSCLTRRGLVDGDTPEQIFDRFKCSDDEDTRQMLYSMLHISNSADKHIAFLLSGIPLALGQVEGRSGRFINEQIDLKRCLLSLRTPEAACILLRHLSEDAEVMHRLFLGDDAEYFAANLVRIYTDARDAAVWDAVFRWFVVLLQNYEHRESLAVRDFFFQTGTATVAFERLLEQHHGRHFTSDGIGVLLCEDTIEPFINAAQKGIIPTRDAAFAIRRVDQELRGKLDERLGKDLPELYEAAAQHRPRMIERPPQEDCDRWFNRDLIVADINAIFDDLGKDAMLWEDFGKFQWERTQDIRCSTSVLEWVRRLAFRGRGNEREVTRTEALGIMERRWATIWISQVFDLLRERNEITISAGQREMLATWSTRAMAEPGFRGDVWLQDGQAYYRTVAPLVAFFIARLELDVGPAQLLRFASFDFGLCEFSNRREILQYFRSRWPPEEYTRHAIEDFESRNRPQGVLDQHFEYFTEKSLPDLSAYAKQVLREDERTDLCHFEAFNYLKALPNAQQLLEDLLPTLKGQTFWTVLADLVELESDVARQVLVERFESVDTAEDVRPRLANLLARYDHLESFRFYAEHVKKTGAVPGYGSPGCFGHLADPGTIPILVDLLKHSYSDQWKDVDVIDTLERAVLVGFRNVALQSEDHLVAVTKAIVEVIAEDAEHAYLHTYLELWQDEFMRQNTRPRAIEEVIEVLDRIESCRLQDGTLGTEDEL